MSNNIYGQAIPGTERMQDACTSNPQVDIGEFSARAMLNRLQNSADLLLSAVDRLDARLIPATVSYPSPCEPAGGVIGKEVGPPLSELAATAQRINNQLLFTVDKIQALTINIENNL